MSNALCESCRRPNRATEPCPLCREAFCKSCLQTQGEHPFSFRKDPPAELTHPAYCGPCFDQTIVPAQEEYDATMERAKQVYVFLKSQKKQPQVLKRARQRVTVEHCADRDETILRLAFLAAQDSYNALLETDIVSEKIRNEGWQKMAWRGSAVPVQVDAFKVDRNEASEDRYR